jgi:hypothetical protein
MSVIPALGRFRQEYHEFEVSLGHKINKERNKEKKRK